MSELATLERMPSTIVLNFAAAEVPCFKEVRGGTYVKYGEDNRYPEYLLDLYRSAAKHGAIISSKATYVAGKGWKTKSGAENPNADAFIAKVNRYGESLSDITCKIALDCELYEGAYLQIIWNNAGTAIAEIVHLDFTRVRTNKDNTQFYWRDCWDYSRNEMKVYPAFNPANPHGSQVYFLKSYSPGCGAYPVPDYLRCLNYVCAEIEVGKHTHTNAQSGFSASKSISFIQGDPSDDEKREISKRLNKKFTGAKGERLLINFVTELARKPVIEDLGQSELTKEDFTAVDTLIQTNIYAGHKITSPALFGISTPGALGQRNELALAYDIFKVTYVNGKQQFIEAAINKLAGNAGVTEPLEIIPTDPVGIDLAQVSSFAPKAWLLEQIGVDPEKYPEAAAPGETDQQLAAETNPLLRNVTGRQWQGIKRLIREVQNGKTSDAMARMMLQSGYGLNDEQIGVLLGTAATGDELQLSAQETEDDLAIAVFAEFGRAKSGFDIIKSHKVHFHDDAEAATREYGLLQFVAAEVSELQASILDLISKDKRITPEVLAETLDVDVATVNRALKTLQENGAIKVNKAGDEQTLTKSLKELTEGIKPKTRAFRIVYSYEGPQDSRNRPFCAKLMELDRVYTRFEIEQISARLGYSVWDRRGGFYTNPTTGETTPYCRHTWMSHVVMEKR